jgi:putative ABC transport system permease protein
MLTVIKQDLRSGARLLARSPGFAFIAVISLAIGIGANTATFSFADGLMLRPLPVPHPSDVVNVGSLNVTTGGTDVLQTSYPDYVDLRDASSSFEGGLTAFETVQVQLAASTDANPEIRTAALVSGNLFAAMQVQPALGRFFRPDEDEAPGRDAVVVLGHRFWERDLFADRAVIGRQMRLSGIDFTIIGIAPESFTTETFVEPDLFVPLMMWPALLGDAQASPLEQRDRRGLDLRGRLREGVTLEQARADVARIGAALAEEYPATNRGYEVRLRTELENRYLENEFLVSAIGMLVLLGAVVLIVACVNVAGLLASRGPAREGEIAVRLSMGASRGRIVRQLLTESALLALGGALTGAAVGYLGVLLWRQVEIGDAGIELTFQMDGRAFVANMIVATVSVFAFGLMPALRASRASLTDALRGAVGRSATRAGWGRRMLVVTQVALSLVLMAVAGFIYTSLARTLDAGPGMRTAGVLTMSFDTDLARYDADEARQFFERLLDGAREVPGVEAAAIASFIPMSGFSADRAPIVPEGHQFPEGIESAIVLASSVDESYFGLMEIPVTEGRSFDTTDSGSAPRVAVVNQALANRFWPDRSAVGQRLRVSGADAAWIQIVGVVPTQKYFGPSEPPQPFMYLPYAQAPQSGMTLVARSPGEASALADPLRALVRRLDPELAVAAVRTMESLYYGAAVRNTMVFVYAIAAMGLMSLTLAFAGLYGLVSSNVSQRTREIGVRMAIGADRRRVLRMVLAQGALTTVIGLVLGVVLTMGADQALRAVFPGGNAGRGRGLTEYVVVILAVIVVTGLATYLPARRASRIQPTSALRYE